MGSNKVINVTDDNFENQIKSAKKMVLLDFWAQWCAPCLTMSTILDELADQYEGQLIIGKVNIDDNPEIPMQFGVRNIPTLLMLKNAEVVATKVGPLKKSDVIEFINTHLAS